jgi:hypothetical protein
MEEGCQQIFLEAFVIKDYKGTVNKTFRWMGEDNGAGTSGFKLSRLGMDPWIQMQ